MAEIPRVLERKVLERRRLICQEEKFPPAWQGRIQIHCKRRHEDVWCISKEFDRLRWRLSKSINFKHLTLVNHWEGQTLYHISMQITTLQTPDVRGKKSRM